MILIILKLKTIIAFSAYVLRLLIIESCRIQLVLELGKSIGI